MLREYKTVSVANNLLVIYFLIFSFRFFTDISFILFSIAWFLFGAIIFAYCALKSVKYFRIAFILLIIDFFACLGQIISSSRSLAILPQLLTVEGFGLLLYQQKKKLKSVKNFCLLIILYLTIGAGIMVKDVGLGVPFTVNFSKLTGQNTVSIILIFCLSMYVIYQLQNYKKISHIPFIIVLIACIFCEGTGGILVASAFLFGKFLQEGKKNRISVLKFLFIVCIIFIILLFRSNDILEEPDDNGRFWIWGKYIQLALSSTKNFLFGAPVASDSFLYSQQNMHNTFINFHYYYGLIPCVFFLYIIARSTIYYIQSKDYCMLVIISCLCLRAITDETSFAFIPIWIYMWLDSIFSSKYKRFPYYKYLFHYYRGL